MGTVMHNSSSSDVRPKRPTVATSNRTQTIFVAVAVIVLAVIAVARIVSTYHVFNQTSDEPAHLATGMEWLQFGTYAFEPLHPPLARVAVALGPYLSGLRLQDHRNLWIEGNELLFANGHYLHNLALARAGVLPFFLFATFLVWYWARSRYGNWPALAATFLFTTSPVVLAHAGLATTDMAAAATFTAALLAYINFLERPTYRRAAILGGAFALAVLSKFSALMFLPACAVTIFLIRWFLLRRASQTTTGRINSLKSDLLPPTQDDGFSRWSKLLAVASLVMFLVVWAGYRFSISSAADPSARPHYTIDQLFGKAGTLHNVAYLAAELPFIPAPALFQGVAKLRFKETAGHKSYLLGQVRETGWWYFFPVALAVKSTIPFLVLVFVGSVYLVRSAWAGHGNWITLAPLVAALTLLLVCMPSHINIGIRHILPIYPLLSLIAGVGAWQLWERAKPGYAGLIVLFILLAWHVEASVRAHPDYLAYFNELAGQHPENVLIDSDLDWGQDLLRLSALLQEKHVDEVSIAYAGSSHLDLSNFGLPPYRVLAPHQPVTGWVAISLLPLKTGGMGVPDDSFSWLEAYQPVGRAGRSIWLYYLPESGRGEMEHPAANSSGGR